VVGFRDGRAVRDAARRFDPGDPDSRRPDPDADVDAIDRLENDVGEAASVDAWSYSDQADAGSRAHAGRGHRRLRRARV